jgi:hypothetical protein
MKRIDQQTKPIRSHGRIRGLTRAQYLTLARMVKRGETSWEELERKGIALPAGRESDFRRSVRRALKQ